MNRQAIFKHIDENIDSHVSNMQNWVRQRSVSWDNANMQSAAEFVAQSYRNLGCADVEILEGKRHPGVWAHLDDGAPITLHNYCMFDTRPVNIKLWKRDPWQAELAERKPYGRVLVGSGARAAKGSYVAFMNALSSIRAVEGTLPANFMFLAEGEEFMGSPAYAGYVERYRDKLKTVSASYCPTSSQEANGVVSVGLGLKGMIVLELVAKGANWPGAPANPVHSSMASLVNSTPFRLVQALATLTQPDGSGCAIDGLEDVWAYRKPLDGEEKDQLDALDRSFNGGDWRDVLPLGGRANLTELVGGSNGIDPLVNFLYGPTLNISGLRSGFIGTETGTLPFGVPGVATAMIDIRYVADMPPQAIIDTIRRHLDSRGFNDIEIFTFSAFAHSQTYRSDPAIRAVFKTLDSWGISHATWPIQGGGGPWSVVPNAFGVPCIFGCAPGGGSPAGEEFFVIDGDQHMFGLADVEKFHVDLLYNVVEALS